MAANINNDQLFVDCVRAGTLSVSDTGIVLNNITGREIGYTLTSGYRAIGLKYCGKVRHILIHRLVYIIHRGTIDPDTTINHIDGNKANNSVSNLENITYSANNRHALAAGLRTMDSMSGDRNKGALLTNEQVLQIREDYESGHYLQRELAERYGVHRTTITKILTGTHYKPTKH